MIQVKRILHQGKYCNDQKVRCELKVCWNVSFGGVVNATCSWSWSILSVPSISLDILGVGVCVYAQEVL